MISRLLSHHASKSVEGSDLWVVPRKKRYTYICRYVRKNNLTLYFTHLPRSPPSKDLHQNWHSGSSRGLSQLWQFFWQSIQGFGFCRGPKFAISHWLSRSPLTQCWRYRAARDVVFNWLFGSMPTVTLTFDSPPPNLISISKNPNTSVIKIGWHYLHWFVRCGVVRLPWPWRLPFWQLINMSQAQVHVI